MPPVRPKNDQGGGCGEPGGDPGFGADVIGHACASQGFGDGGDLGEGRGETGQAVGEVVVELNGSPVTRQPLVALASVPEGGIWRSVVDNVLILLE
mgnify:CR=1 FL=1